MKIVSRTILFALLATGAAGLAMANQVWVKYQAKEYGFSMLIPQGTTFVEGSYSHGWNSLAANYEGVKIYALAKLGDQATPDEIENVGVNLTGIPGEDWTVINKGSHQGGWIWYRTVEATRNGKLIIGDYGAGSKGSYLMLLETTTRDYELNKSDYATWYGSIQLH